MDDLSQVKDAKVKISIEAERAALEGKELDKEITRYHDWGDASNEEIEEAMRKVEDWKRRLSIIEDRIYSMKKNVLRYDLSSYELDKSTNMMENLKEGMELAISVIEEEDDVRGIYSLSTSKASDVELPKYGGKPSENFLKFKNEMLRGFKANKVRREDQINKLRDSLFDLPRTLVPPSMGSISDAWKILDNMYGDLTRVMYAKIQELKSLRENPDGGYPCKGKGMNLLNSQVEWITRLEVTLNEIMDLGEQSKQLDRDAFCSATLASVLDLFPFEMQDALEREIQPAKEDGKERMHFIIKYLRDLRKVRQRMQNTQELRSGLCERTRTGEKDVKRDEQMKLKNEILEIRQEVYSKLNAGKNVVSIMKKFKRKVEVLLRKYKADFSFEEEKHWRDKIVITEKAVVRRDMELKHTKESCSRKEENLAPSVQKIFDAARAQEIAIENLPEPPDVDKLEERLERLKEFNKKVLNDRDAQACKKRRKICKGKVKVKSDKTKDVKIADKKVGTNDNDINSIEKVEDIFDMDRNESTESGDESVFDDEVSTNGSLTEYKEVVDVIVHETDENEVIRSINDKEYQAEVKEFNDWYYSKLEERKYPKVDDKRSRRLYDKVDPNTKSVDVKNSNDEEMYKQIRGGACMKVEVDNRMYASMIIPLIHAIVAMLLISGKTLQEHRMLVNRLSKFSRSSLYNHLQPEITQSSSSPCSCQAMSRVCSEVVTAFTGKVSSMANKVSTYVTWTRQIWVAVAVMKEKLQTDIATISYQVGRGLFNVLVPETEFERVNSDKM